jgi:dTDP-4-dehydro-6-deoxy-alpha-D-glucopyranose 2,3-dehydratase
VTSPGTLLENLDAIRTGSPAWIRPMRPSDSQEWLYGRERIFHKTGRFFSIVGLESCEIGGTTLRRHPVIDQPEVGTLAFLFRKGVFQTEVLVQIKGEPGNMRGFQLAPTCQATLSNLDRAHGGKAPPGAPLAETTNGRWRILSDSVLSEQGTRFLRKRNRNVSLLLDRQHHEPQGLSTDLIWTDARVLLRLLLRDFTVNTDARSVLVTTPWESLATGEPFGDPESPFAAVLRDSYRAQSPESAMENAERIHTWLRERRQQAMSATPRVIPLDEIPEDPGLSIRHVEASIPGRERERWDQPLFQSRARGLMRLCAFRKSGQLFFIFRAAYEPGLIDRVELHPTVVRGPGYPNAPEEESFLDAPGSETVLQVWQSEEGGRFLCDRNLHQIALLGGDLGPLPEHCTALSLREIEALAPRGVFTNEARSTVSLLLACR